MGNDGAIRYRLRECFTDVKLTASEFLQKRDRDLAYLMELKEENLLFPFLEEAGLMGRLNYRLDGAVHGGWDSPLSQIRGTFTGHWLSAAARLWQETGDRKLKAKADDIVEQIGRCQEVNGGGWAFPIPEKYLYALKKGQHFWAPQYVCHKVMMGLMDMYKYAGNGQALQILEGCAGWFTRFTQDLPAETMERMMDDEETGGIMELWSELYAVTGRDEHLELARRYERHHLTEPLLSGEDVLTNMHANATIPEVQGCARLYGETGEERYRQIAESYWREAVENRECFATGSQTDGEIWTPSGRQAARLSHMNQEHCVVYNMIRLADALYRLDGDKKYADYIEMNLHNGLLAQGFYEHKTLDGALDPHVPDSGIVCYYLPLAAGSRKKWGRRTEDFWCCHGTAVQANARYREWIWYREEEGFCIAQYIPSVLKTRVGDKPVKLTLSQADLGGNYLRIEPVAGEIKERPCYWEMELCVEAMEPVDMRLRFRLPWWIKGKAAILIGGEQADYEEEAGYACLRRAWKDEKIILRFYKEVKTVGLADEPDTVAFLDGPVLLAGLTERERRLYGDKERPAKMLAPSHEREWESWQEDYRVLGQEEGLVLRPLKRIGREAYTVYFPLKKGNEDTPV